MGGNQIRNETKLTKELYDVLLGILMQWRAQGDSGITQIIENCRANDVRYFVHSNYKQ
jgi:hypothetical protein